MSLALAKAPLALTDGPVTWKKGIRENRSLTDILTEYMKKTASLVFWLRSQILWGSWDGTQLQLADKTVLDETQILEIRAFNENEELHLYRKGNGYEGRYVCDGQGPIQSHVDSLSRLWGHRVDYADGYAVLIDEERFLKLTVPCTEKADYYGLVTRNYIEADPVTGQAGYRDYRFVRIEAAEGGR